MKRRTTQPKRRRDRKGGKSPYQKYGKSPMKYDHLFSGPENQRAHKAGKLGGVS